MIKMKAHTNFDIAKVQKIRDREDYRTLGRAGAFVRSVMRRKVGRRKTPRPAGQPMASPSGLARSSIVFSVDRKSRSVVIGPLKRMFGGLGQLHEFGGVYKGRRYPARPYSQPSLEQAQPKIDEFWASK